MKNWELTGGAVRKHRGVVAVNYARYEDLARPLVDVLLLQQQQQKACTRITRSITPTLSCMFANLTNRIPGPGPRPRRIQKRMHGACFSATAEHLTVQLKSGWKNFAGKSDLRRTWWTTVSTKQFFLICIKHFSDFWNHSHDAVNTTGVIITPILHLLICLHVLLEFLEMNNPQI